MRTLVGTWFGCAAIGTILTATPPASRAQAPLGTAFSYQGQLKAGGSPVDGPHDFLFRLYDASTGGTQIGVTQCADNVSVTGGLFTVTLDFGGQFSGDERFLEIEVRADAGLGCGSLAGFVALAPRQPLTAVPYALYAFGGPGGAGGFWSPSGSHIFNTNAGRVGIGTDAPEAPLHVFGGSAGTVTAHPNSSAAFERGGANYLSILSPSASERGLLFGDPGSFVNGGIIYNSGSVPNGFQFRTATNTTRMVITEPGNVGMGTTAPDSSTRLHAVSASTGVVSAVRGETASPLGTGVVGTATSSTGLAVGVTGSTSSSGGVGVMGSTNVASGECFGVWGINLSTGGRGVYGQSVQTSGTNYGVYGSIAGGGGAGVHGENTGGGPAAGVHGANLGFNGTGVRGIGARTGVAGDAGSASAVGVTGSSTFPDGVGVVGLNEPPLGNGEGIGVYGQTTSVFGIGVYGLGTHPVGQYVGVRGATANAFGYGVFAAGNFGASGTKSFVIDHPSDPENRYLKHYCAEGPEPLNVYGGAARLDGAGRAVVELPDYFAEINRDPRIQLTAAGAAMPNLHASESINDNKFEIAGGAPGRKVYWEVKAVRNDPWVRAYGAPVDVLKPEHERGKYQRPELYGQPAELGIDHRAHFRGASATSAAR